MIELHKGHGPTLFKNFQKVMVAGLFYIVLNGILVGVLTAHLRQDALIVLSVGLVAFVVFAFLV